jgi:CubicO group peptidase (beta-lactamase class C family)
MAFLFSLSMHRAILIILFLLFFQGRSQSYYFPPATGQWDTVSPQSLGWCADSIQSLYSFLDTEQTKSFLLLKDGKIVLEKYFNGHDETTNWVWYSAGKSLRATLIGIAQGEGKLSIQDPTSQHLGNGWSSMSVQQEDSVLIYHHLSMTTGLNEQYFSCTDDSCLTYKHPVGSRWFYQNAAYNLTKDILESATGQNHNIYTQQKIKTPTGMNSGIWVKVGYNDFFFSRARDMARFGILIANKGNWDGNSVVPDTAFISDMLKPSQILNPSYGYLWWLNGQNSIIPPGDSVSYPVSLAPNAPSDVVLAAGSQGQYISISKSTGLIMIRQGQSNSSSLNGSDLHNRIWKRINGLNCNSTTISEVELNNKAYPIPASNEINLPLHEFDGHAQVEIYDSKGLLVMEGELETTVLSVSHLRNGFYILHMSNDDKEGALKISIQR